MNITQWKWNENKFLLSSVDPRLKNLGQRQITDLRNWFDKRLENAIRAAEEDPVIEEALEEVLTKLVEGATPEESPTDPPSGNVRVLTSSYSILDLCLAVLWLSLGFDYALKLFYLATDSVIEASVPVVAAAEFIEPIGVNLIEEERKKTGIKLTIMVV